MDTGFKPATVACYHKTPTIQVNKGFTNKLAEKSYMANWYKKSRQQEQTQQDQDPQAQQEQPQDQDLQYQEYLRKQDEKMLYFQQTLQNKKQFLQNLQKNDPRRPQLLKDINQLEQRLYGNRQRFVDTRTLGEKVEDMANAATKPSKGNPFTRLINIHDAYDPNAKPGSPRRTRNPYSRNPSSRSYRMR